MEGMNGRDRDKICTEVTHSDILCDQKGDGM